VAQPPDLSAVDPANGGGPAAESEALDAYSRTVMAVAERLAPSVANLRVTRQTSRGRLPSGAGSGVVLTPDGFLLTSAHVVDGRGRQGRASFVDGTEFPFAIVGTDPFSDLALLRVCRSPKQHREPSFQTTPSEDEKLLMIARPHGDKMVRRGVFSGPVC